MSQKSRIRAQHRKQMENLVKSKFSGNRQGRVIKLGKKFVCALKPK